MAKTLMFENSVNSSLLRDLQQKYNSGRGISCVQDIVMYLERDDISRAKAVASNERDKIEAYPDVLQFLVKHKILER